MALQGLTRMKEADSKSQSQQETLKIMTKAPQEPLARIVAQRTENRTKVQKMQVSTLGTARASIATKTTLSE